MHECTRVHNSETAHIPVSVESVKESKSLWVVIAVALSLSVGLSAGFALAVASVNQQAQVTIQETFNAALALVQEQIINNWVTTVYSLFAAFVVYKLYRLFLCPLWEQHDLTPLGREVMGNRDKTVPHPYPNTWFKLMDSWELKCGEVKHVKCCGVDLAIYRTAGDENGQGRGEVVCLDAHCPHLGANLAVDGKVKGNCIECPFHGWQFNGEGKCTHIPYAEKVPDVAKTNFWHVREVNQQIWFWFDANHGAPTWELPERIGHDWSYHGRAQHHVACHIQDIPENGPDVAHLGFLHAPFLLKFMTKFGLSHCWSASWEPRKSPEAHIADITLSTGVSFMGRPIPFTVVNVTIEQVGPSCVFLSFPTPFGRVTVNETLLPIAPTLQRAHNIVFAEPWVPRFVAKFLLKSLVTQFERDVPIWCNKKYLRAPMIIKEDGPILKYRRWMKQFWKAEEETNKMDW